MQVLNSYGIYNRAIEWKRYFCLWRPLVAESIFRRCWPNESSEYFFSSRRWAPNGMWAVYTVQTGLKTATNYSQSLWCKLHGLGLVWKLLNSTRTSKNRIPVACQISASNELRIRLSSLALTSELRPTDVSTQKINLTTSWLWRNSYSEFRYKMWTRERF